MDVDAARGRRLRIAGWGTIAALVVFSAVALFSYYLAGRFHSNDFKHLWAGARILLDGGSPYDPRLMFVAARQYELGAVNPFVYLPATGLILAPLAWLSFGWAAVAWAALNWALAWGSVVWGAAALRLERPWPAALAGALFLAGGFTFSRQMTAGQMNVVILACLVGALALLMREREFAAGLALGFAGAFKIAPLFMGLPLVGLRRWRAVAGMIVGFAALNLAAVLWAGVEVHRDAVPVLSNMGYGQSTWAEQGMDFYRDPFNQSFNALFHRLFTENPYSEPWAALGAAWADGLTVAVSLAMLMGYGAILWRAFRLIGREGGVAGAMAGEGAEALGEVAGGRSRWGAMESVVFLIGVLLMLLLPSLMWDHYAVQALLPLMWLAGARERPLRWWEAAGLAVAFWLLAMPWLHHAERWKAGAGVLMMSPRLWGTLILLVLLGVRGHEAIERRQAALERAR